jgi:hypothetical protein
MVFMITWLSYLCEASNFYGGTMSAEPIQDLGISVLLQFNNQFGYKRLDTQFNNGTYCDDTTIQQNDQFNLPSDDIVCLTGCINNGEVIGTTADVVCQAYSVLENWSYGSNTFAYTAPKSSNYQITYTSQAWGLLAAVGAGAADNATDASWQLTLTQNLENRKDTNAINTTPVTLIAPFISIPQGIQYTLSIPTIDADGDTVKCKLSF